MTGEEWVRQFAAELGAEAPTPDELDEILKLAAIAAHASERTAAPIACWVGGRTGRSAASLREVAKGVNPGAGE
jgi:Domain of unknown function (DUF6457)